MGDALVAGRALGATGRELDVVVGDGSTRVRAHILEDGVKSGSGWGGGAGGGYAWKGASSCCMCASGGGGGGDGGVCMDVCVRVCEG